MNEQKNKTIKTSIGHGSQDVIFDQIIQRGAHKLRIDIRSDSYQNQCHARIFVWSNMAWSLITEIHHDNMITASKLKYKTRVDESDFADDRRELIETALEVLK